MTPDEGRRNDAEQIEDFDWALDRVQRMCASAYLDAQVYGKRLLKGFGYPNESFSRAQDARALSILLNKVTGALSPAGRRPPESAESLLREAIEIMTVVYAGNFPSGIESFLVRADATIKSIQAESAREAVRPPAAEEQTTLHRELLKRGLKRSAGQDTRDAS